MPPAVILAAGESSRFWPLSTHGHKSLHRLAGRAVIEHTVASLVGAGVSEIIIVQSPIARAAHFPHRTVADHLGDGSRYGATIRYLDQAEADGPGPALRLAIDQVEGEFFVVNPESINAGDIVKELWQAKGDAVAVVAGQAKEETWLFGVCELDGDRLVGIVEKPEQGKEPSQICRMAVELVGPTFAEALRRQPAHELSNIFALQALAEQHYVKVVTTKRPFFPLKYPWHLFALARFIRAGADNWVAETADVSEDAFLGPGTVVEADAVIGTGVSLANCLIGAGCRIDSSLADSILGAAVHVGPDVTVAETTLTAGHIYVDVKGDSINSQLRRLGTVIGQGCVLAPGTRIRPGVLLGAECRLETGRPISANLIDRTILVD